MTDHTYGEAINFLKNNPEPPKAQGLTPSSCSNLLMIGLLVIQSCSLLAIAYAWINQLLK